MAAGRPRRREPSWVKISLGLQDCAEGSFSSQHHQHCYRLNVIRYIRALGFSKLLWKHMLE